ncbi:hypothetical protein PaG_01913 [Moesziomyces aphidis]|uniref:Uncharacterized protein n=1 Tax=Moesziomyces aphidis TaxID=84754 RepID=W3VPX4_MOEAP|nr:hypothetical protein PaG_01913 [Moesziomyces aphidis]
MGINGNDVGAGASQRHGRTVEMGGPPRPAAGKAALSRKLASGLDTAARWKLASATLEFQTIGSACVSKLCKGFLTKPPHLGLSTQRTGAFDSHDGGNLGPCEQTRCRPLLLKGEASPPSSSLEPCLALRTPDITSPSHLARLVGLPQATPSEALAFALASTPRRGRPDHLDDHDGPF